MVLLTLLSLVPYMWLLGDTSAVLRMPPIEVLIITALACIVYHAVFLYACKRTGYSLLTIACFFFWIFMGLAPLMCSITGRWAWGDITFELKSTIVAAECLSLGFYLVMLFAYRLAFSRAWFLKALLQGGRVTDVRLMTGLWFSLAMSCIVFYGLGVEGTFFRSSFDSYLAGGPFTTFVQTFIRPMPLLIGIPMFWFLLSDKFGVGSPRVWLALVTMTIAGVINFPLSVARFYGLTVISIFF